MHQVFPFYFCQLTVIKNSKSQSMANAKSKLDLHQPTAYLGECQKQASTTTSKKCICKWKTQKKSREVVGYLGYFLPKIKKEVYTGKPCWLSTKKSRQRS